MESFFSNDSSLGNNQENNNTEEIKAKKLAAFKDNSRKIRDLADSALTSSQLPSKKPQNLVKYRLNLTEFGISDGYTHEFSREISFSEFDYLLGELFGVFLDHVDDEDDEEDEVLVFENLDEVINYLKNKQENGD